MYIAARINDKDLKKMKEVFTALDKDSDGKLSPEEIQEAMKAYTGPGNFKEILEIVDVDQNGFVDYSEWLTAAMDREIYINRDRLADAFAAFDTDKCGKITIDDLKIMVGTEFQEFDETVWKMMIAEADTDGDGAISFEEFIRMMNNIKDGAQFATIKKD